MSCARVRPVLTDVALGARASTELLAHLAGCVACRQALAEERRAADSMPRELESSLASRPSKAFQAQLRERAESEPQRAQRRAMLWLFPAAASLVVLGLVIMRAATLLPEPPPSGQARPLASAPPNPVAPEGRRRVEAPERASTRTPSRRAPRLQPPPSTPSAEPEVLVPPGERLAFEQFLAGRSRWRLDSAPPASEGLAPLAVERLALAPLEVRPLAIED